MKIMQGDSYPIYIDLTNDGIALRPSMIDEMEVFVREYLLKTYTSGGVVFDDASLRWYIRPTQQETFDLEEGSHEVIVRVKYKGSPNCDVIGTKLSRVNIIATTSREVI